MSYQDAYGASEPARADVDAMPGPVLLEFGAPWCGHCRAAQSALRAMLAGRDGVSHLKIEDGRGRALGRNFGVKLWPTLILLRDGQEQARVVRPLSRADLAPVARALSGG
jgi:thioredoxin 1